MSYYDCYVHVSQRSKKLVDDFLNRFLPSHSACASEYEIPQYSDEPTHLFKSSDEALEYLEKNINEEHALYWDNNNKKEPAQSGMVFPTSEGTMIFGISCDGSDYQTANRLLKSMQAFLKTDMGYITQEEPPVTTLEAFTAKIEKTKK